MKMPNLRERFRVDGRVAFVTGGAQGIGLAVAHALGETGATVVIGDLEQEALDQACEELRVAGS